jgi:hypothetical protein
VALAVPALCAGSAAAAPPPIALTSGHADWGLKESFRNYINGPIAHGQISVSDGATVNDDGSFRFTLVGGTYDLAAHAASADFDGTVHFTGHDSGAGPLLDLTLSDPRVETVGDSGTLYADMKSKSLASGELVDYPDVALAALDLSASGVVPGAEEISIAPIAASLTESGVPAFADFYPAGTVLDPLALTLSYAPVPPTDPDPDPDPGPGPNPPGPGPQTPPSNGSEPPAGSQPAAPPPAAARIATVRGQRRVGRQGIVKLASVACRTGSCRIAAPGRVRLAIAGRRYAVLVLAPKRLAAGGRATIRLKLPRKAVAALAGRRARVRLSLSVRSGGQTVRSTVRLTLVRAG